MDITYTTDGQKVYAQAPTPAPQEVPVQFLIRQLAQAQAQVDAITAKLQAIAALPNVPAEISTQIQAVPAIAQLQVVTPPSPAQPAQSI